MIVEDKEAIHPTRIPAQEYALDIELVKIAFSWPTEPSEGGVLDLSHGISVGRLRLRE